MMSGTEAIITVEVSMYPLRENYREAIDRFLEHLHRYSKLNLKVSETSTLVIGTYREVFSALQTEIKRAQDRGQVSFVMKVLRGDLSEMQIRDYHAS